MKSDPGSEVWVTVVWERTLTGFQVLQQEKYFMFCPDDQEVKKQKYDVNPAAESWAGSSWTFVTFFIKENRFIYSFSLWTHKCWFAVAGCFAAVGDFAESRSERHLQRHKQKHSSSFSSYHYLLVYCVWPHSSRGCWEIWDVNAESFVSSSFLWEMFFLPSFCHPRHLVSTSGLNGTAGSYFKVGTRSDTQPRQTRRLHNHAAHRRRNVTKSVYSRSVLQQHFDGLISDVKVVFLSEDLLSFVHISDSFLLEGG